MPRIDPATGERMADAQVDPSTGERVRSFVPQSAAEFGQRLKDAAIDVPVGMVKQAGRLVQMIPGVAAGTDALYGLPAGASAQAMQPANPTQTAGGYVADLALMKGLGSVGTAGKVWNSQSGWIDDPTVGERAGAYVRNSVHFTKQTISALKDHFLAGEAPTPEHVATLIAKYGGKAVQAALLGAGFGSAWKVYKDLF